MIWLAWRQFRVPGLVLIGVVVAAMLVLVATGPDVAHLSKVQGKSFFDAFGADTVKATIFYAGTAGAYALPAVIGLFWGAPMVSRELEAGTQRLAWNQSVTRARWLATKLGVAAAGAVAIGLFGLVLTHWSAPLIQAVAKGDKGNGLYSWPRLSPVLFGTVGIVPIGMAVLGLLIGVTLGLVIRRVVPAMAITLALVVAVQVAMPVAVQAHLLPQQHVVAKITQDNVTDVRMRGDAGPVNQPIDQLVISIGQPDAWIISNLTVDGSGHVVKLFPKWASDCAPTPGMPSTDESIEACFTRLADEGYRQHVDYLPARTFWPLQLIETGVLLGLAALLTGFCFWRLRRDLV